MTPPDSGEALKPMNDDLRAAAQRVENAIAACLQEVDARPDYPELYAARDELRRVLTGTSVASEERGREAGIPQHDGMEMAAKVIESAAETWKYSRDPHAAFAVNLLEQLAMAVRSLSGQPSVPSPLRETTAGTVQEAKVLAAGQAAMERSQALFGQHQSSPESSLACVLRASRERAMSDELKPCPFCHGPAWEVEGWSACKDQMCGGSHPMPVAMWNRRAERASSLLVREPSEAAKVAAATVIAEQQFGEAGVFAKMKDLFRDELLSTVADALRAAYAADQVGRSLEPEAPLEQIRVLLDSTPCELCGATGCAHLERMLASLGRATSVVSPEPLDQERLIALLLEAYKRVGITIEEMAAYLISKGVTLGRSPSPQSLA